MFSPQQIDRMSRIDEGSLTGVKAVGETRRVHLGVDEGSFDSAPVCGDLAFRTTETTGALANCPNCKQLMRLAGKDLCHLFEGVRDDYRADADRFSAVYFPDHD